MQSAHQKIFVTLFFSIFAAVTGVGIVVPLLPIYAHDLGASGLYISLIFGVFSISRTFFLPYFGSLSDKKGRKPFIVAGLFAYTIVSIAFVFSNNIEQLIVIRFFQGIASAMIMPVCQAYVGEITTPGKEGITMGIFNMSVFLSLSLGPILGGVFKDRFGLDFTFYCMGSLSFISFMFSLIFLPPRHKETLTYNIKTSIRFITLLRDTTLMGLFVFRFAYTACIGILWSFLPLFASSQFKLTSSEIGILIMLAVFVSGILQTPMGFLADRVSRHGMVFWGGMIAASSLTGFLWANGFWTMICINILFGIGGGISMPAINAIAVIKGSQSEAMGSVMSLLTMAHSLGMMMGALFAGIMMDLFNLRMAFVIGSVVMFSGLAAFFILARKDICQDRTIKR